MGVGRALPWRRAAVPVALKRRVAVSTNARIIGWSWIPDGGWAVATESALVVSTGPSGDAGDASPLRIPWGRILKATWADGALEVIGTADGTTANARYVLSIAEDGLLAESVRTLVTGAVVWSQRIEDGPARGAWVAARRESSGEVSWTVAFDAGLDPTDPGLREWADDQVMRIRAATGL